MDPREPDMKAIVQALQNQIQDLQAQMTAQPANLGTAAPILGHVVNIQPDRPPSFSGKKDESLDA